MVAPFPFSRAAFTDSRSGAHSVGVADGGPGLPIVGWSTTGGDLRITHFAGLHAMQLLPLFARALARPRFDRLGISGRLALVRTAGCAYLGLIVLLAWQAARGQSIVAPDATTLAAFGALCGATALVSAAIVVRARRAGV